MGAGWAGKANELFSASSALDAGWNPGHRRRKASSSSPFNTRVRVCAAKWRDEFQYDPASDSYVCPAGQRLHPYSWSLLRGLKKANYVNKLACDGCAIRARCTRGPFRTVSRLENEAVLDRMAARLAKRPGILDLRRETVEHPLGSVKQWMGQGAFLTRGLERVRAEFSLTALAYNLRRALNIVGFAELMAAAMG